MNSLHDDDQEYQLKFEEPDVWKSLTFVPTSEGPPEWGDH